MKLREANAPLKGSLPAVKETLTGRKGKETKLLQDMEKQGAKQ